MRRVRQPYTRVLLVAAHSVILSEGVLAVYDRAGHVDSPTWQWVAMIFLALNIYSIIALRPRLLMLVLAALNVVVGVAFIVAAMAILMKSGLAHFPELDFWVAASFFAGVVPLVTAFFLFGFTSRSSFVQADAP